MPINGVITAQTGGRQFDAPNLTNYSLFVGGLNATHHALYNYSPLMNGFGRLFMVRPPKAIVTMFSGGNPGAMYSKENLFIQFKHILEYMNRSVTGFGDKGLAGVPMQGGFAGRTIQIPTITQDPTTAVTIGVYEPVGSPMYAVLDGWMNAIGDENSGLATYGGFISGGKDANQQETRLYRRSNESAQGAYAFNEANHTAEFIYILHDRSGAQVERAVMLADCYPSAVSGIGQAALDMPAGGSHDLVTYDITFNCTVYRSPIITSIANDLLKQYRIVSNSLNFNPELGDAVYADGNTSLFRRSLGAVPTDSATGTNIGNLPAYDQVNIAKNVVSPPKSMDEGKLAGQQGRQPGEGWENFV